MPSGDRDGPFVYDDHGACMMAPGDQSINIGSHVKCQPCPQRFKGKKGITSLRASQKSRSKAPEKFLDSNGYHILL